MVRLILTTTLRTYYNNLYRKFYRPTVNGQPRRVQIKILLKIIPFYIALLEYFYFYIKHKVFFTTLIVICVAAIIVDRLRAVCVLPFDIQCKYYPVRKPMVCPFHGTSINAFSFIKYRLT